MRRMDFLAAFYTHYGAMRFYKHCAREGLPARMAPVPREISASCGVCVLFSAGRAARPEEHEDMERCYVLTENNAYAPAEG